MMLQYENIQISVSVHLIFTCQCCFLATNEKTCQWDEVIPLFSNVLLIVSENKLLVTVATGENKGNHPPHFCWLAWDTIFTTCFKEKRLESEAKGVSYMEIFGSIETEDELAYKHIMCPMLKPMSSVQPHAHIIIPAVRAHWTKPAHNWAW